MPPSRHVVGCNSLGRQAVARLSAAPGVGPGPSLLPDPGARGPFEVSSFLYAGPRNPRRPEYAAGRVAVKTAPVDLSALFSPDPSAYGYFLDTNAYYDRVKAPHWGFDEHAVPLNGKVWYPRGEGPFPLVVCVHGNHDPYEASEFGYEWLGTLLASRGIVFASVDENFLNGRTDGRENDARAALLLEHARTILAWDSEASTPLHGKLDTSNVALVGHSRGGEAAANAAILNRLSAIPDNAAARFDWDLPIKAVVCIAPVEGQYRPAGRTLPLPEVSFLLLHGSADGDADCTFGLRFLNRGTPEGDTFRSSLWIYGANHAQFNTDWAKRQDPQPTLRSNLLTLEEQQKVAGAAISAFLEACFGSEPGYREFFKDPRIGRAWLPPGLVLAQYRDADGHVIADFEEDGELATVSDPGWTPSATGFSAWGEQPVVLDTTIWMLRPRPSRSPLQSLEVNTWVTRLRWEAGKTAQYDLRATGTGSSGNVLSFDLAAFDLPSDETLLDVAIDVVPVSGAPASFRLRDLYRLTEVPASWVGYKGYSRPQILSTVRVPLPWTAQIGQVRFRFDGTESGVVLLDNIAIREETSR